MPWTLASVTIHPGDNQYSGVVESNYAIQQVLDAVVESISYYGANSERRQLEFALFESENSGTGLSTLIAATKANSNAALVGDTGSLGNHRILSFRFSRKLAANHSQPVYECQAELIVV